MKNLEQILCQKIIILFKGVNRLTRKKFGRVLPYPHIVYSFINKVELREKVIKYENLNKIATKRKVLFVATKECYQDIKSMPFVKNTNPSDRYYEVLKVVNFEDKDMPDKDCATTIMNLPNYVIETKALSRDTSNLIVCFWEDHKTGKIKAHVVKNSIGPIGHTEFFTKDQIHHHPIQVLQILNGNV